MRVSEDVAMPRSYLMKKYGHCPPKKRPVQYFQEFEVMSDDNSEPENLSTKPEDLSRKTLTPPPATALVTGKKLDLERHTSPEQFGQHFLSKTGGPLEPLNLNTTHESQQPTWPRAVPAHYPSHYIPLNYLYPPQTQIPYYAIPEQLSPPYAPHERSQSPPRHAFTPFRSQHVPVITSTLDRAYYTQGDTPLSPTSTSSTNSFPYYHDQSPPPISPEDLSSPGSVSSNNSGSEKKVKDSPRYKCSFCSKSYSTYSGLSKHQQFHCAANEDSPKKKFKCKYCDKEYNSLGALKMHIRTHTLPCKCKLCGKAFSRPWLLQGHIRTHTGEKPFSCQHCNRAFADRSNLRAHLQTHSDVKKYSCPTCSKTFSRMSLLSKHTDGGCPGLPGMRDDIKPYYIN